ncbi:MAG TPA: pyridoxal phosphate-dependent aminotransferase [Spirochaetota bacterium]|nr:pyridoxal phosphate-dependent aminotransferase [Spirochaetota bacterium]HOT19475.1 pyridoxal phosphate-dependent aminotransferase [Spirochaetota bacterium]HPD04554.1 pyridoxal phosphate-dependent aminotransferase [Spirochaetota bacterium]HQG42630.1 pyridoxal phosphate-dependent aminotransferase [Spirochaetota bacterium]HQK07128.1 pyridoxal phosphate-dependent aminotransferase [Spirochaetota bacterium]
MELAHRLKKIKPSATLAVTALANSLKAQGVDVIGFGSGEPDFDTPQSIKDAAIKALVDGKTKYTPSGGIPELKKAIVQKFKRDNNLEYKLSEVTVNCGGKHSFYNLMQVLLNSGDEVIIPAPYWVSYPDIVLLADGTPVVIHTDELTNFKITPEMLKKHINKKTKAVVINSPSNPTGSMYTLDELKALGELLKNYDICIITDDIYESIVYNGNKFYNILNAIPELKSKTMVLNGVSKTYSMTGWRIGYMAGDETIIKQVEMVQSQSVSNPTSIAQWAAVEAIMGDQSFINEMLQAFTRRKEMIVKGLNDINGVECHNPDGAFYVFPNVKKIYQCNGFKHIIDNYKGDSLSSKLSSYLLEEARVAVVPGVAFGSDNNVRLSFATSDKSIIEGLKRIQEAIEKLV